MSFPSVTPQPIDELSSEAEFALRERDRVVYEIRRLLKKHETRYMFWHAAPPGACGLVLRDPLDLQVVTDRLKEMGFEVQPPAVGGFQDFRSPSGQTIRVLVRLASSDELDPLPGPTLLITTHTVL